MHHEDIKASIRKSGTSPAALARSLKVTSTTVSNVIRGNTVSARIAKRISQVTGMKFSELWPGKYPVIEFVESAGLAKVAHRQTESPGKTASVKPAPYAKRAPKKPVAA